jgi:hypothetical protein
MSDGKGIRKCAWGNPNWLERAVKPERHEIRTVRCLRGKTNLSGFPMLATVILSDFRYCEVEHRDEERDFQIHKHPASLRDETKWGQIYDPQAVAQADRCS